MTSVRPAHVGLERDSKFCAARWRVKRPDDRLMQCSSDSKCRRVVECIKQGEAAIETLGRLLCYVNDMLLLSPADDVRQGLIEHMHALWKMSTEVELSSETPVTFLGLELDLPNNGRSPHPSE